VPQCGATFNEHRCTLDKDHEGWHQEWVERLVDTATWQDAPEVPHLHDGSHCCMECSDYGRQGAVRMYPCPTIRAIEGDAE
jgi:hypothetical protein